MKAFISAISFKSVMLITVDSSDSDSNDGCFISSYGGIWGSGDVVIWRCGDADM